MPSTPFEPGPAPVPSTERRPSPLATLDGVLFGFAGGSAVWLAWLLLSEGARPGWSFLLLGAFWVLFSYLLLPRLHRILTRLYVPGYFIGRARTSDGLLGDPVNLALIGTEPQVHQTMRTAGWTRADDLSFTTGRRIVTSTLRRRSYAEAPVSPLQLFDRQQDFAYQQEVAGSPSKRHHVRFWRCPGDWMLPGGFEVEWLAAGTYDRSVGLSLFTFQITHKIEQNTDVERDYLVSTITTAQPKVTVAVIANFSTGYHSRNGGGDLIQTDGDLPVIDVRAVPALGTAEPETDSRDKRPAQMVFGSLVGALRGALLGTTGLLLLVGGHVTQLNVNLETTREAAAGGSVLLAIGVFDVALAAAAFSGRNWARILLMLLSVLTITTAFLVSQTGGPRVTVGTNLPTVAISILVLLALTSHRARDWSSRDSRAPRRTTAQGQGDPVTQQQPELPLT
jgi:hypothetical protein